MKRKYTMTRIYEPLYSKLKAEAAKKGVHVSVLINERLKTQVFDIANGDEYRIMGEKVSGVNILTVTSLD
jgi:hypothetical protein